jgi:plastocyanin
MRSRLVTLAVCAALVAFAGCGSSSSSSRSSSGSAPFSTASTATPKTVTSSGLKATTTPKFVTASGPVRSGTVQIAYRNIAIFPDAPRVKVGSTIKWTNFDNVEHNVTSRGGSQKFASKNFGEGATFEIKAQKPGVIHYLCTLHPASMNGTIEIVK